jgi:Secretion system C-terminal sorting domain
MKKLLLVIALIIVVKWAFAQTVPNCNTATPFCLTFNYVFTNVTNQASYGANGIYGCLGSTPNAKLFYFQVTTAGNIVFTIAQNNLSGTAIDVDFVAWGPFTSTLDACANIASTNTISCSYSGAAVETCTINNAQVGQYYYVLVTNFSGQAGTITFTQTAAATGTSQCLSNCALSTITANTGPCTYPINTYTLNGQITFLNAPTTGSLTVTSSNGATVNYLPPFTSPLSYSIPNLNSTGIIATVTAVFSSDGTCFKQHVYNSPSPCNTCFVSVANNSPLCTGSTLNLSATTTVAATFAWAGPNNFISAQQNPTINNISSLNAGTYTLTATDIANNFTCVQTTTVSVVPTPSVTVNSATVCAGTTLALTATVTSTGGNYLWLPGNETTQSIQVTPSNTASYAVMYNINSCPTATSYTTTIVVKPRPVITCNSTTVCTGQQAVIIAVPNLQGGTYYWLNGGATTSSITVSPATTAAYVVFYNLNGCSNSAGGQVVVVNTPLVDASGFSKICSGQQTVLNAATVPANGTIIWSNNAGFASSTSVSPTSTNTFTVSFSSPGCNGLATDTVSVLVIPTPSITATSATICDGESVVLYATGTPTGGVYSWDGFSSADSLLITPSNSSQINVSYTLNNCSGTTSASVVVNAAPAQPVITQNGVSLLSSAVNGNQWYLDGQAITGANGQLFTPTQSGNYTVVVTQNNCVSDTSLVITVNLVGITEIEWSQVKLYPNPAINSISITTSKDVAIKTYRVMNTLGETMMKAENINAASNLNIDVAPLKAGIYYIQLSDAKNISTQKFVKQ